MPFDSNLRARTYFFHSLILGIKCVSLALVSKPRRESLVLMFRDKVFHSLTQVSDPWCVSFPDYGLRVKVLKDCLVLFVAWLGAEIVLISEPHCVLFIDPFQPFALIPGPGWISFSDSDCMEKCASVVFFFLALYFRVGHISLVLG